MRRATTVLLPALEGPASRPGPSGAGTHAAFYSTVGTKTTTLALLSHGASCALPARSQMLRQSVRCACCGRRRSQGGHHAFRPTGRMGSTKRGWTFVSRSSTSPSVQSRLQPRAQRVVPAEVARQVASRWQGLVKLPADIVATLTAYFAGEARVRCACAGAACNTRVLLRWPARLKRGCQELI